ncbi:MAG: hypothetical protein IJF92_03125 [Bacilli bacterium]|nr:hypothetical protein [Bacilli bacterium]
MRQVILFILSFIVTLIIYELFVVNKAKKNKENRPIEVKYLVNKYKVDLKKANYNQMLQIIALISSLDIALIAFIVSFFKGINIQILVGVIIVFPTIIISYMFVGNFYKKKGMIRK